MKTDIDAVANFTNYTLKNVPLSSAQITTRQVNYAVPANTTVEQWQQINRAVTYAESQGVKVKITSVK